MKTKSLSMLIRVILIILGFLIILLISIGVAGFLFSDQKPASDHLVENGSDIGQLQFADGSQMSSDNFAVAGNLNDPTPMFLPLKTLADFASSSSATVATINTSKGVIVAELFLSQAPLTVANFTTLVEDQFYDGLKIHRYDPNFVIQVGDPASREASTETELLELGTGYPGYRIADEFHPDLSHDQVGILSMANINVNGDYPHSGGSQFFITLAPATYLDGRHAIFGRVTDGLDILEQLRVGDVITSISLD